MIAIVFKGSPTFTKGHIDKHLLIWLTYLSHGMTLPRLIVYCVHQFIIGAYALSSPSKNQSQDKTTPLKSDSAPLKQELCPNRMTKHASMVILDPSQSVRKKRSNFCTELVDQKCCPATSNVSDVITQTQAFICRHVTAGAWHIDITIYLGWTHTTTALYSSCICLI